MPQQYSALSALDITVMDRMKKAMQRQEKMISCPLFDLYSSLFRNEYLSEYLLMLST